MTSLRSWLPSLLLTAVFAAATGSFLAPLHGQQSSADSPLADPRSPQVYPPGEQPDDRRLGPLQNLNGHFPFSPPETLAAWEARAKALRERVLIATGLWPMPAKTPLNPVIHGQVQRDGFTVEKVYMESLPGHFVTGLLFRPDEVAGDVPAVLCPHGHGGRMQELSLEAVRRMIVNGQERFEASGRYPKLARCVQLARMGCVVFMFDMLGYADSQQISYEVAHRYAEPRPDAVTDEGWLFYSTPAELRLQSIMGLQVWNAIRSLDFLEQLPGVDPNRLAVTGNSGGGTQTILLGAIDPRPVVTFPNGMVSTSMQGGCTCENCALLRIGTGNVELAALLAPRPQAMTAADDWTIEMMTDGYPQLQQVYALYGKRDNVLCRDYTHFPHNFNYVTRGMMYQWFNRHLGLGLSEPIVEEDYRLLSPEQAAIWDDDHPQPAGGPAHERAVGHFFAKDAQQQFAALQANDPAEHRQLLATAWHTILRRSLPAPEEVTRENRLKATVEEQGYLLFKDILQLPAEGESFPTLSLYPKPAGEAGKAWNGEAVLWVSKHGKASLLNEAGLPVPAARDLLDRGYAIIAADLFGQGEFRPQADAEAPQRIVENKRHYAGYTYGYNDPLFVKRVHDLLTLVAFTQSEAKSWSNEQVHLYGREGGEPLAAAAAFVAGEAIDSVTLASERFRFAEVDSYRDPDFVPGSVKYGDLPGLLELLGQPLRIGAF